MTNRPPPENGLRDDHLLPVAELIHRVRNEYARTIALASTIAAKSASTETKAALHEVTTHLHASAEIYNVLRPPVGERLADLAESITRLCFTMTDSSEFRRRGIKLELRVEHPILIDTQRCWRTSLIVAELITNSCRHAFPFRSGCIFVAVGDSYDRVFCNVSDDGSAAEKGGAGLGTRIVDALAAELDGVVERRFSESGATVLLSFPKTAAIAVCQPEDNPIGQMSLRQSRGFPAVEGAHANPF